MLTRIASSLALFSIAAGCAAGGPTGSDEPAGELADRLAQPLSLAIVPSEGGSHARVTAVTLRDGTETPVEIAVVDGSLAVALEDGQLRVDSIEVAAADVHVGPGIMPPDGVTLTGISLSLASPMDAAQATITGDAAVITAHLPVDFHWAAVLEHGVVDLAPIRLPELPFELAVELTGDGEIEAHLTASQPGRFWTWAGIFELRDLELDVVASTGYAAPDQVE